jgi:hypothetical protein
MTGCASSVAVSFNTAPTFSISSANLVLTVGRPLPVYPDKAAADPGPAAPSSPNLLPPPKQESLFSQLLKLFFDSIGQNRKNSL